MCRIAVIIGSTRPGCNTAKVARWVHDIAARQGTAEFDLVDIGDWDIAELDEPVPPSMGQYTQEHTFAWAEKIRSYDGFVFVTPEYNHSIPGALKTAIDFVYAEWNDKAAGIVTVGTTAGGVRAAEHLRLVLAEVQVATVCDQVSLAVHSDFENYTTFKPAPHQEPDVVAMLEHVVAWSTAMQSLRVAA